MPGADDERIFGDILRSLERDRDDVRRALAQLAPLAGGAFAELDPARRTEVAAAFRETGGAPLGRARPRGAALLLPRRPRDAVARPGAAAAFPQGHVVEQGDWSLLDPVRARPPMYRSVD